MIMFPVLFQPQITPNSVIRDLLWLLCQPNSGPLTVCWPGASLLEASGMRDLEILRAYRNLETTTAANQGFQAAVVVIMKSLFLILSLFFFLWELSLTDVSSKERMITIYGTVQIIWQLELSPIVLPLSSPLELKSVFFLKSRFICTALRLTACLIVKLATCVIRESTKNIKERKTECSENQTKKVGVSRKEMFIFLLSDIWPGIMGECCKSLKRFDLLSFLTYTLKDSWCKSWVHSWYYESDDTIFLRHPLSLGLWLGQRMRLVGLCSCSVQMNHDLWEGWRKDCTSP